MASALVIYKSKYGSTKQYAEWISQEIGAEAVPVEKARPEMLDAASIVVFGGYLHAGSIAGADFIRRNSQRLEGKKVAIFTVSGTSPEDPEVKACISANFPPQILQKASVFPLRGRAGKLDLLDSALMFFPKMKAYLEYKKTGNRGALEAYEKMHSFDFVDRASIAPMVKELKRLA